MQITFIKPSYFNENHHIWSYEIYRNNYVPLRLSIWHLLLLLPYTSWLLDFFLKLDSIPERVGVFRKLNDFHSLKKPQAKFQEKKKKNLKSKNFSFFAQNKIKSCFPSLNWIKIFTIFFHFICRFPVPTAPQSLSSLIREKHFQYLTSKMMKKSRYSESMGFRELQKKCNANDLYKTFIFQWKSSYLTLRDLPYGPA